MDKEDVLSEVILTVVMYLITGCIVVGFIWEAVAHLPSIQYHQHDNTCYDNGVAICGKVEGECYAAEPNIVGPLELLSAIEEAEQDYYQRTTPAERMKNPLFVGFVAVCSFVIFILVILIIKERRHKRMGLPESEYVKTRKAWAIVNGALQFQEEDNQAARDWLRDVYNVSDVQFEGVIRGGLFRDRITICQGTSYKPVDMNKLPSNILMELVRAWTKIYGGEYVEIHNGCHVGAVGDDWEPIQNLGKFGAEV